MPDFNEIQNEIHKIGSSFDVIRRGYLKKLHKLRDRNIIIYYSGWQHKSNVDPRITSINDEDMGGFMTVSRGIDRSKGLDLILNTPGGGQAAAERLVDYLRSMFNTEIEAFVPHLAASAGTMIACACKKIFMGKHSSLGPIDPQINEEPAQSIIDSFNQAHEDIKQDPSKIVVWYPILSKYNLSLRDQCQNAIDLTEKMVTEWLSTGMFSNMDEEVAQELISKIVGTLKNYGEFKSHNRHLSSEFCKNLGLKISFLEEEKNRDFQDAVLSVHHACVLTFLNTQAVKIIENHNGAAFIQQVQPVNRVVVNQQGNSTGKSSTEEILHREILHREENDGEVVREKRDCQELAVLLLTTPLKHPNPTDCHPAELGITFSFRNRLQTP